MAEGEGFAGATKKNHLVGEEAGEADAVDRDGMLGAFGPSASEGAGGLDGCLRFSGRWAGTGSGDDFGGAEGGAARGVRLSVMVHLDDLDVWKPTGGHLGKAHHQHGADREVGDVNRADSGFASGGIDSGERFGSEAGGAEDGGGALGEGGKSVGFGDSMVAEIEEDIRLGAAEDGIEVAFQGEVLDTGDCRRDLGKRLPVTRAGDGGYKGDIVGGGESLDGFAAHATIGAGEDDADRLGLSVAR